LNEADARKVFVVARGPNRVGGSYLGRPESTALARYRWLPWFGWAMGLRAESVRTL